MNDEELLAGFFAIICIALLIFFCISEYNHIQSRNKHQEWVMDNCTYDGQMPYLYVQKDREINGIRTFYKCPDGTRPHYDTRGEW